VEKRNEELELYNRGEGELTFVIQSRENEQNARLVYVESATMYHKLLYYYWDLFDALLE
jgi:hypothetical protein